MPSGFYKRSPEHLAKLVAHCRELSRKSKGSGLQMQKTSEYNSWRAMIARCFNPHDKHFYDYGGRGITVCERWRIFSNFFADVGSRPSVNHSLDRINNDGNYEPSNCRRATAKEQVFNRRLKRIENFSEEEILNELSRRIPLDTGSLLKGMEC